MNLTLWIITLIFTYSYFARKGYMTPSEYVIAVICMHAKKMLLTFFLIFPIVSFILYPRVYCFSIMPVCVNPAEKLQHIIEELLCKSRTLKNNPGIPVLDQGQFLNILYRAEIFETLVYPVAYQKACDSKTFFAKRLLWTYLQFKNLLAVVHVSDLMLNLCPRLSVKCSCTFW